MKKSFIFFFVIVLLTCYKLNAQNYLPGVTAQVFSSIQSKLSLIKNDEYDIDYVLNVDSSLGSGLGPLWPEVGQIEDPYNTLKDCYVFLANRKTYFDTTDSSGGIIGIYKNEEIIWQSGNDINLNNVISSGFVWAIKDINRDGEVDIMTTWISQNSHDIIPNGGGISPYVFLWIISWDGNEGKVINNIDTNGVSKIMISSNGLFSLADIEGDGIWEIQGDIFPVTHEDSLKVTEESNLIPVTFSWNGNSYDRWPDTPQPPYDASFPRDKINVTIKSKVELSLDSLSYYYRIYNSNNSFQDIAEFAIKCKIDSNLIYYKMSREYWGISLWGDTTILCWGNNVERANFISRGEEDNNLILKTSKKELPVISTFYISGLNSDEDDYNEIFTNSVQVPSIVPSNPPAPFMPLEFLDTLITYDNKSYELGWIKDSITANKYTNYFTTAKTQLQQNNIAGATATLNQVLQDVDQDSTSNLTSEAYALIKFNTEYLVANMPASNPPNLVVQLTNSGGSSITGGSLQYYDGGWKDAVSNGDGTFGINTDKASLSLRMTYEYGSQTVSNVTAQNNTFTFHTVNVSVQLQNSQGVLIDSGTVKYYAGSWRDFGSTTNGVASKELLPNNYSFRMTYKGGNNDKQQNIGTDSVVIFQTVNANVQLQNSQGVLIDSGAVQYYAGAWREFGTTINGVASKELLPNNYSFRMTYEYVSNDKQQNIGTNNVVVFSTVLCTINVVDSQNQLVSGADIKYYSGAWREIGLTVNGQVTKELLPKNLTFRMNYNAVQQDKSQDISDNSVVDFNIDGQ